VRESLYPGRKSLHLGKLEIDNLTFHEALDAIAELVERKQGGTVFTPNVDHVVLAESDEELREAYEDVSLSLVDGTPVMWVSRLLGCPLPEKISGSDLVRPLMQVAAQRRWRVYLLGGAPGVAERAAEHLKSEVPGLLVVGTDAPQIDITREAPSYDDVIARINAARPDVILVAFGCPKQEIFMHRIAQAVRPAVALGIGAGLDFEAGMVQRAPRWVSAAGLEWLYRLVHEPRRLWRRYLARDPKFLLIVLRELREHSEREAA
jgi:N-acetylglucosaminyldiphosphoundecaprenol N-acetyl-beta-D-mannosaminyltransferase